MPVCISDIIYSAEIIFDITYHDIISRNRLGPVHRARAAVCLAASIAGRSYAEIGAGLGGRAKSNAYQAAVQAEEFAKRDPQYRTACDRLVAIARGEAEPAGEWRREALAA